MKKHEWFKETKKKKEKDKSKELAKDILVVAGSVAVLGLGLSLLD